MTQPTPDAGLPAFEDYKAELETADATGNEDQLVQTVFPPDEFPDPPQNTTDLGREAVVVVQGEADK